MAIVDLTTFKAHLRLGSATDEDPTLQGYLDQATALVLDYVRQRVGIEQDEIQAWEDTVASWLASPTPEDIPPQVPAAILRQATELYRFRGDDVEGGKLEPGALSPSVTALLYRHRDPAIS